MQPCTPRDNFSCEHSCILFFLLHLYLFKKLTNYGSMYKIFKLQVKLTSITNYIPSAHSSLATFKWPLFSEKLCASWSTCVPCQFHNCTHIPFPRSPLPRIDLCSLNLLQLCYARNNCTPLQIHTGFGSGGKQSDEIYYITLVRSKTHLT